MENISIVLYHPKFPGNIGSAARAMKNMGFSKLIVISDKEYELDKIKQMATHAAEDIVNSISWHKDINQALAETNYIVGTTARLGRNRKRSLFTPDKLAEQIEKLGPENKIAILFGPEDSGLQNNELRLCHAFVSIPTSDFSSLNLAQAVMIISYTIFSKLSHEPKENLPKLATRQELDALFKHMQEVLVLISFMQKDNTDYWLDNFRHLSSRFPLRAREARMLRGIFRQIEWYGKSCYEKGLNENIKDQGRREDL